MPKETIAKPQPLKLFSGDPEDNWRAFKEEWEAYEHVSGLTESTSIDRVITFLRVVGKDALNIYNSFSWKEEQDSRNIDRVIEKFEALCLSDKSTRFHRYLFYKREHETGEKLEDYVSDVRKIGSSCGFGDKTDLLVSDKIIFSLKNRLVREELLKSEETDPKKIVELIQEAEERQKEKLKEAEALKKTKGKGRMADEQEMLALDDMNGEEEEMYEGQDEAQEEEAGDESGVKGEDDELILKADSDDELQEEESEKAEEDSDKKDTPLTKRDTEFTSEDFKIELRGLPRYYAMGQLKKLLNETLQLKAHKIKPAGVNKDWAYVTFRDEKSRNKALAVLDDYQWRKATLTSSIAKAVEDPVAKKAMAPDPKLLEGEDPEAAVPINDRVVKSVTPLALKTYEDQLQDKQKAAHAILRRLGTEMAKTNYELKPWVRFHKIRRKGQICEIEDIIPSPVTDGYRNKCEFTIGINPEDQLATVGFRVSNYKSGCLSVGPVDNLVHIPDSMKNIAKVFQEFVRNSPHTPFSPLTHEGVWRQLTVRTSTHDDILIAAVVHPQEMTEEELGDLKQSIVDYFKDGGGASAGVTSIFFQAVGQKEPGPEEVEFEHLWGEEYITETVLGKTFRVSCESFFQVNTKGCEVLYETIANLAELDGTSVILDVCCGTGTIGVSLADQCLKVYGIEMVKKAAEDARHNAELNGLDNVAIYTGKAEQNMNAVLSQCAKYNTVGIVDPPRAGLSESVIRALRKCENMNYLLYLSCDPEGAGAFKNFIDLSRPKSKNYKGEFFVPVRAAIVDMFPHTNHYELLILFERWEERKWRRIMEGNPLPRDEEYFKRIPPKPEGVSDADSEEEENVQVSQNTGFGNWKNASGGSKYRRYGESYQPYSNPRQQFGNQGPGIFGQGPGSYGGGFGGGYMDNSYFGGRGRGGSSNFDGYYNEAPNRMFDMSYGNQGGGGGSGGGYGNNGGNEYGNQGGGGGYGNQGGGSGYGNSGGGSGYGGNQGGGGSGSGSYGNRATDPYRLCREEYDFEPFSRRSFSNRGDPYSRDRWDGSSRGGSGRY